MALDVTAKLEAYKNKRAQRITSHLQVAIQPRAMILCPLVMAGEDIAIHALAFGRLGEEPKILTVADPRFRDDFYALLREFRKVLRGYAIECYKGNEYPQLWVSSEAASKLVESLAESLRYNSHDPEVKKLGELLTYFAKRSAVAGQQALHTATGALKRHFATGQDEIEDEHLLALLTWVAPPSANFFGFLEAAEKIPMGIKTNPEYDRDVLAPLVYNYNKARRRKASDIELEMRKKLINDVLDPIVRRIYTETQRAISILRKLGLPELESLFSLEQREIQEFFRHADYLKKGGHFPLLDSPKVAAFKLTVRENAEENMEAALQLEDRVKRGQALLEGKMLQGVATRSARLRTAPRNYEYSFVIESRQENLRLRAGDELILANDPRLRVVVDGIHRVGSVNSINLRILKGQKAVGIPATGETLEFVKNLPDWGRIGTQLNQLRVRTQQMPWTHQKGFLPAPKPARRRTPENALKLIDDLRRES